MRGLLAGIGRRCCYLIAGLVILAAIVVILSRLFVPLLDRHRPEIENWAGKLLSAKVSIDKARFSWYRYQPEITFSHVTVLDEKSNKPKLEVERLSVFFSIIESLLQKKLVPSAVAVSGSTVKIVKSAKGDYSVQGFRSMGELPDTPYSAETSAYDFLAWLSSQPRLTLKDINVQFKSVKSRHEHLIKLKQFSFDNNGNKHVVLGKAVLQQTLPTELEVAVRWNGSGLDPDKVKAKAYIYAKGVSLPQWVTDHEVMGWQVEEGVGSAKVWITWEQQAIQKVQALFKLYQLDLFSKQYKRHQLITSLSGDLGWKREGDAQIFAMDDVVIDLPTRFWPMTNLYAKLLPGEQGLQLKELKIGYLPVDDTIDFITKTPQLVPADIRAVLDKLDVRGDIYQATFVLPEGMSNLAAAEIDIGFAGVGFKSWKQLPGVINISGALNLSKQKGILVLNSKNVEFKSDMIFKEPVLFDQLSGRIEVLPQFDQAAQVSADGADIYVKSARRVQLEELKILNEDLSVELNGHLLTREDRLPTADLHASFELKKIINVTHYLPMHVFDKGLETWLNAAFLHGGLTSGTSVLRGDMANFPFDHGHGEFSVTAKLNDVGLQYAPEWPAVENIMGTILFKGRDLKVHVDKGTTMGVAANNVDASIPSLGSKFHERVNVEVRGLQATLPQALEYVRNSPLNATLGKVFAGMQLDGPVLLNLALVVPLNGPGKTSVLGAINVDDAVMNIVDAGLMIKDITGQVKFTEKQTSAERLQASLFGKPFAVKLMTEGNGSGSHAVITSSIPVAVSDIDAWLNISLTDYLEGVSSYKTKLTYSWTKPLEIEFTSDLIGTKVAIDSFANKLTGAKMPFSARLQATEGEPLRFRFNFANKVSGALLAKKKNNKMALDGLMLAINDGDAGWPKEPGLSIDGQLAKLDWPMIKKYSSTTSSGLLSKMPLKKVSLDVDELILFGQRIQDVALDLEPEKNGWNVDVDCSLASGSLFLPKSMDAQHKIIANFSRVKIDPKKLSANTGQFAVSSIPGISFAARQVVFNRLNLGSVKFEARPNPQGMIIDPIRVNSAAVTVSAKGSWLRAGRASTSFIEGTASTGQLSALLLRLGINAENFVANKASVDFDLSWPGSPFAPSANLNGSAKVDVGAGRIVNIGEDNDGKMGIARLLNLFSLQTIPRRLTLNFSDLVEEGYSFDYFRSDVKFKSGNAYTSNMRISGPSADVRINGRIGLLKKDYDLTLSITPHVTQSLPLAATILTGQPLVGLAAMAVNTVLGQEVSKATTYHYDVTGSWSQPNWQQVSSVD